LTIRRINHSSIEHSTTLRHAVVIDLGDLTDPLLGDGQPLAFRVDHGHEVFGGPIRRT
jgi:hypothetical protein